MRTAARFVAGLAFALPAFLAQAEYPDRPLRFVVAFAPGGTPDVMGRVYAAKLKDLIGQPIVVDNRPGATGAIGADLVAKAPGDGYTMLLNSSAMVINPWVTKQSFDFRRDLTPLVRMADTPYVIAVNAKLPITSFDEFIAYARKNPGKLACATYGIASPPHLSLELLKVAADIDILHIPYRTFAQTLPDLESGQLGCNIDPPTIMVSHARAGRIRIIAHTGDRPMASLPEAEPIGRRFPSATVVGWQAIFAPAATPAPILQRLRAEWARVVADPEVRNAIRTAGFEPSSQPVDEFEKAIQSDYKRFGDVIREGNIRLQ